LSVLFLIAFYSCNYALRFANHRVSNVNLGIELPNNDYDIFLIGGEFSSVDMNMGGKNGDMYKYGVANVFMENKNKQMKFHEHHYYNGEMTNKDTLIDSGDPYRRSNGADSVIEISCGVSAIRAPTLDEWKYLVFEHEFEVDALNKNYRYYVQCKNMSIVDVKELFLECEYIDQYVSDSVYHTKKVKSDKVISERTGVDDWSQYLEVTGIYPAVKSKVRIKCFLSKYDVDGRIFIDPKVGIFT